jgi:hypothetical protein
MYYEAYCSVLFSYLRFMLLRDGDDYVPLKIQWYFPSWIDTHILIHAASWRFNGWHFKEFWGNSIDSRYLFFFQVICLLYQTMILNCDILFHHPVQFFHFLHFTVQWFFTIQILYIFFPCPRFNFIFNNNFISFISEITKVLVCEREKSGRRPPERGEIGISGIIHLPCKYNYLGWEKHIRH